MKPLSIRIRLTLFYIGVLALVLLALGVISYHALVIRLDRNENDELEELAAGLRGYLKFEKGGPVFAYDPADTEEADFVRVASRFLQIYDADTGEMLQQSPELAMMDLDLSASEARAAARRLGFQDIANQSVHLRFHNTVMEEGKKRYLVRVGVSLTPIQQTLDAYLETLAFLFPLGLVIAALGGWWMARMALRPIEHLRQAAGRVGIRELDRRLPVRGTGDELDKLAETFNRVLSRLQDAVEQMKQFTGSISHELRTPLAALQGEAEVALLEARSAEEYRRILGSQLEELEKLRRLINDLLLLARADAGEIPLQQQALDLGGLVRSLAEQLRPLAEDKNLRLEVAAEDGVEVSGDPQWLERVILNLADNAMKFTAEQGCVRLGVKREGSQPILDVEDTGIGIPPEALPHIFDRSFRADTARSRQVEGAGLGLALVRWIVEAHRAEIKVESRLGQGTHFTILFPAMPLKAAADPSREAAPIREI